MQELTMELAVGDVVVVGTRMLTVIDIEGDEISFRVDPAPPENCQTAADLAAHDAAEASRPRRAK